jgi:hypothetical protein
MEKIMNAFGKNFNASSIDKPIHARRAAAAQRYTWLLHVVQMRAVQIVVVSTATD